MAGQSRNGVGKNILREAGIPPPCFFPARTEPGSECFFKRHRFQRIGRVDRHHQAFRTFPAQVQHQASAGGIGDGDTVISPPFHQGPGSAAGRNEIFLQHGKVFPLFRTGNPPAPCLRTGKGRNLARPVFIQEERGRTDLEKTLQLRRAEKRLSLGEDSTSYFPERACRSGS